MLDVLSIGVCTIDLIARVPRFPEPDGRVEILDYNETIGGVAAVAPVALARLGARVGFAGAVGADAYGERIRAGLLADGVDVDLLVTLPDRTTRATIILSDVATNTRSIINTSSAARARVQLSEAIVRTARSVRLVHLDQTTFPSLATDLLPHCRRAGVQVSVDAGVDIPAIETYLPSIDIYITTGRQLLDMTGEREWLSALRAVRAQGPRVVVATLGEEGSVGLAEDGTLASSPAFAVKVADTTGAGDVYHGAFLFALLEGQGMREALRFANAAAALSCRAVGGRPGCPTLAEVQALLATGVAASSAAGPLDAGSTMR